MEIDTEKVDEITLALFYLTTFKDKYGLRAWSGSASLGGHAPHRTYC